jgi:hypothetical protein
MRKSDQEKAAVKPSAADKTKRSEGVSAGGRFKMKPRASSHFRSLKTLMTKQNTESKSRSRATANRKMLSSKFAFSVA